THGARTIRSIPLRLEGDAPDILEVRGEVYLPLKEFNRINAEREAQGLELYMNPRNAAGGTMKNLDAKLIAARRLGFLAHGRGVISDEDFAASHTEFLEKIRRMGVATSKAIPCQTIAEAVAAIQAFD